MNYQINDIVFDTAQRTLSYQNKTIQLEAKSYELLVVFITHTQEVLSRDKLIALAWQGSVVSDGAVNKAISKLRQHFEQLQPNTEFIITKPKFGYQLGFDAQQIAKDAEYQQRHISHRTYLSRYLVLLLLGILSIVILAFALVNKEEAAQLSVQLERITAHDGFEQNLSASNYSQVLFLSSPTNNQPRRVVLQSLKDNSQHVLPINMEDFTFASLSPSGASMMWVAQNEQTCKIMRYNFATGSQQTVFNCSDMQNVRLSWQANELAIFIRARKNNASPYIIHKLMLATNSLQQLSLPLQHAQMKGDFLLAAHPRHPLLAYARYVESSLSEIHIVNSNTLETVAIHPLKHMVNTITWSSQSDHLFIADKKILYRLNANTGEIEHIKQLSYPIESIAATTRDAKELILVSQYHASSSIQSYNIKTKHVTNVFSNAALNRLPRHDQNGLLFISDMGKEHALWRYQDKKLTRLNIPFEFGFNRYHVAYNAHSMVFEKLGAVYEYDFTHNTLTNLISAEHQAYAPNYGMSEQDILYSSNKTGQWQLWQYNKGSASHQQLTKNGGYSGYFYNGQLYFSKRNQAGMWTLESGAEKLLIKDFSNINWLNWQVINGNVYFYKRGSGIWQYNIDSQVEQLLMSEPEGFIHQYDVSDDEKYIVYAQLQPMQGDIQAVILNW
ncbi:winged helix-turn-helix transcriptional regulator [Pseudoalteromonas sp. JBTF-M23]|uniref:Winged helix-turn-helix transcriptional regulator n=1 Tax=Pseudoalteromonas caenipelagi TaxID=2726988 RepID=A0A849VIM9_9GAMM|nr:winged helix-turn-helix domain-containing protein [Pseudoalteromonas caenipelagi]NOU52660.1 winged helix-turn-helix transcriptional regulator [Pseudoalteromonas caenipelagi]